MEKASPSRPPITEFRTCPFCKERIPTSSSKCPFCAEIISESAAVDSTTEQKTEGGKNQKENKLDQPTSVGKKITINMTVPLALVVVVLAALCAFYIWSSHNRFYIMAGSQGIAYEIDRKTGETWMLRGVSKTPHDTQEPGGKAVEELPPSEGGKITGNAGLGSGYFSGKIYNGSSWTVTKIIVTVTALEENGNIRWTRDFAYNTEVQPLTTASLYIEVTGEQGIKESSWTIKSAWGYRK